MPNEEDDETNAVYALVDAIHHLANAIEELAESARRVREQN